MLRDQNNVNEEEQQNVYQPNNYDNYDNYNQNQGHHQNVMPLHLDPTGSWYWDYYLQDWHPYYPQNG